MDRRTLLRLGLGATVVLAVAGGGMLALRPSLRAGRLEPGARAVMRAVALAVLDGALPQATEERDRAIESHLQRLEAAMLAFPNATRAELSRLLSLLASAPGRSLFARLAPSWSEAGVGEVQASLEGMRLSSLALRQQAYHALRDLTNAAYFSDPSAWAHMGYPGPADL